MRHEDTESSAGTAISFLLIGLGIGAVVGLLCAPKTGRQMRKDLRRKLDDARGTFDDWRDEARDLAEEAVERGAELAEEVRDRVKPLARSMKRR